MKNKLRILAILSSIIFTSSCVGEYIKAAHEYPYETLLGYKPADTAAINNLYHMDKKGNLSLAPNNPKPAVAPASSASPAFMQSPFSFNNMQANAMQQNPNMPNMRNMPNRQNMQQPNRAMPMAPTASAPSFYGNNPAMASAPPTMTPPTMNRMPNRQNANMQGRRYPALNNYSYPYQTSGGANVSNYGRNVNANVNNMPNNQPRNNFRSNRSAGFNPQIEQRQNNFPEITTAYPPYQKEIDKSYQSNYLTNRTKKHMGLIDGDYFSPRSKRKINEDTSLGYNYKISNYKNNNIVIDDVDNNILDDMIRHDPLSNRFKLQSLPSY